MKESLKHLEQRLTRDIKSHFAKTGNIRADLVVQREGVRQCLGGGK